MASIGEYRDDIRRYRSLKEKILRICEQLERASRGSSKLENEIASSFKVNNVAAKMSGRIDILGRDMRETADYLRNTIIPSINSAIDDSYDEIDRLEEEEEEDD